jgi:branched-chain amino acid transport system permease protein
MRFHYDTSYLDAGRLLRYPSEKITYGGLIVGLLVMPWVLPPFYLGELTYLFILAIASLGLMVLVGFTGLISLGHAAFLAIGAYAHAWAMTQGLPFVPSIVLASALAGLVGLAIGLPVIRVSGLYLAMVTLAFSIVIEHVIGGWTSVTGGYSGLPVPPPVVLALDLGAHVPFYFLCLTILAAVLLGLHNLLSERIGRALIAVRDSEAAASSLGIWTSGYKVLAFVISAFVSGLAGALMAHKVQYLTPEGFGLALSLELMLMVVIGGLGSLRGAVLGAILIGLLPTAISKLKPLLPTAFSAQFGLESFLFGLILALFVLFEPGGLNGRWLKLKVFLQTFPLYRKDTFRRGRSYMRSERYR